MGLRGRTQRGVLGWLLVLSGAEASGGFCRVDMHCGDLPEDAGTVNVAYCEFHRSVFAFFFLSYDPFKRSYPCEAAGGILRGKCLLLYSGGEWCCRLWMPELWSVYRL
jgi:hypothetical protein